MYLELKNEKKNSKGQVLCILWRRKVTVWYGTVGDLGERPQGRGPRGGGLGLHLIFRPN